MKSFEIAGRVHKCDLKNNKINKVERKFSLYINVYKADQLKE